MIFLIIPWYFFSSIRKGISYVIDWNHQKNHFLFKYMIFFIIRWYFFSSITREISFLIDWNHQIHHFLFKYMIFFIIRWYFFSSVTKEISFVIDWNHQTNHFLFKYMIFFKEKYLNIWLKNTFLSFNNNFLVLFSPKLNVLDVFDSYFFLILISMLY